MNGKHVYGGRCNKVFARKGGEVVLGLIGKYGSAVSAIKSKVYRLLQLPYGGRNADKGLSDGMECIARE